MYVSTHEHDGLFEVVIDRPERRNALDGEGWRAIAEAFGGLTARPEIRVALLRSNGEVFCGGGDLGWMRAAPKEELARIGEALEAMRACPRPIVCQVQGPTYGGGVGLVAAADVVVAGPNAQFTLSEVRLGIAPALISPYLIQRVGPARFKTWALLGTPIDVASALSAGLVDVLANEEELDGKVAGAVAELRRGEPEALAAIKLLPREGLPTPDAATLLASLRARDAFVEGVAALKEHRAAAWASAKEIEVGGKGLGENEGGNTRRDTRRRTTR